LIVGSRMRSALRPLLKFNTLEHDPIKLNRTML
jgi:hypothetical protein